MHILQGPSFMVTMMIGDPQDDVIIQFIPCSKNYYNCLFISSTSMIYFLCSLMFGNGGSNNNYISCSTSLLGGIPLFSWNTPLYAYKRLFKCCLFSLVHPYRDSFTFFVHFFVDFVLKKEIQASYFK